MKILLVHNFYQKRGGEYSVVKAQKDILEKFGHEVVFYSRDNSEIIKYGILKKLLFFLNGIFSVKTFYDIKKLISETQPDIAHIHNVFPLISPSIYVALSNLGIPIVQTIHNFRFMCPNGLFFTQGKLCERCKYGNTIFAVRYKCFRNSYVLSAFYALIIGFHRKIGTFSKISKIITLTEFSYKKIIESDLFQKEKITILGNPFTERFGRELGEYRSEENYIIFLGRLSEEKDLRTLINAMEQIPTLKLKILGDGPQKNELVELINNKGMKNVEFLGFIDGDEKFNYIRNALAVIIPSIVYENFSLTLLESMFVGTTVIASRIGSFPFIIDDDINGLLFTPKDNNELRQKIEWVINFPEKNREIALRGKKMVESKYSEEKFYTNLIKIYREVSKSRCLFR